MTLQEMRDERELLMRECESLAEEGFSEESRQRFDEAMTRVEHLQASLGSDGNGHTEEGFSEAMTRVEQLQASLGSDGDGHQDSALALPYEERAAAVEQRITFLTGAMRRLGDVRVLTLQDQRSQLEALADDFEREGVACPQVYSNGESATTYMRLRMFLRSAPVGAIVDVVRGFSEANRLERRRLDIERFASIDFDRRRAEAGRPLTPEEQAAIDEENEHARKVAEHENSVESRLGRVEGLLERLLEAKQ